MECAIMATVMLTDHYSEYRRTLDVSKFEGKFMDYDWGNLPSKMDYSLLAYSEMFREHSTEIANAINQLTNYSARINAWKTVIDSLDTDQSFEVFLEFVEPIATISLNLPNAIKSRFYFAVAQLAHQANHQLPGKIWKDDIVSDEKIKVIHAAKYGKRRPGYWR
jgi:hypothetical protein